MKNKFLRLCAIIGAVIIIGLAIAYAIGTSTGAAQVREARAAFIRDGAPTTPADIIPPPVADADNAAILYNAVALRLKSEPAIDPDSTDDALSFASQIAADLLDGEASPEAIEQLRAQLATNAFQTALLDVARAAAKPGYRQDLDYNMGAGILLPHLSEFRYLNRILLGAAILAAEADQPQQAWDYLTVSAMLANQGADEPLLISQLVRMANVAMLFKALPLVGAKALPEVHQFAAFEDQLTKLDNRDAYALSLHGERILLGEWAFNLDSDTFGQLDNFGSGEARALRLYRNFGPVFHRDHAAYLRYMYTHHAIATTPYDPADADVADRFIQDLPRYYILTQMIAPALSQLKIKFVESQAKVRLASVYVGLLRAKRQGLPIPTVFNELDVVGNTTDPFTGDPLRYVVADQVVTIYSLGPDQTDNDAEDDTDDVVIRLPRAN